jgi:alpha-glucosidase
MLKSRSCELRLPADWPPASVTVNGVAVKRAGQTGKGGWSFEGNTLTTVIPTPSFSTASRVIIEVRRAPGLTARRDELDGFAGAMTRLRGAYDAMHQSWPVSDPPDLLIDAMQTGDRLGYHPENAVVEIAHFHEVLPKAQAVITGISSTFAQPLEEYVKSMTTGRRNPAGAEVEAQKQRMLDAVARAERLVMEAGK